MKNLPGDHSWEELEYAHNTYVRNDCNIILTKKFPASVRWVWKFFNVTDGSPAYFKDVKDNTKPLPSSCSKVLMDEALK